MKQTHGRMDTRMDRWTDRWTDGGTDVCTDSPCVLQDFVPFESAALLTSMNNFKSNCHSRARVPMTTSCLWATGFDSGIH